MPRWDHLSPSQRCRKVRTLARRPPASRGKRCAKGPSPPPFRGIPGSRPHGCSSTHFCQCLRLLFPSLHASLPRTRCPPTLRRAEAGFSAFGPRTGSTIDLDSISWAVPPSSLARARPSATDSARTCRIFIITLTRHPFQALPVRGPMQRFAFCWCVRSVRCSTTMTAPHCLFLCVWAQDGGCRGRISPAASHLRGTSARAGMSGCRRRDSLRERRAALDVASLRHVLVVCGTTAGTHQWYDQGELSFPSHTSCCLSVLLLPEPANLNKSDIMLTASPTGKPTACELGLAQL